MSTFCKKSVICMIERCDNMAVITTGVRGEWYHSSYHSYDITSFVHTNPTKVPYNNSLSTYFLIDFCWLNVSTWIRIVWKVEKF